LLLVLFIIGYNIIIYKVLDKGNFKEIRLRIEVKESKDSNLGNKNIIEKFLYIKELVELFISILGIDLYRVIL
jgi:hypothetical protein